MGDSDYSRHIQAYLGLYKGYTKGYTFSDKRIPYLLEQKRVATKRVGNSFESGYTGLYKGYTKLRLSFFVKKPVFSDYYSDYKPFFRQSLKLKLRSFLKIIGKPLDK